jgi:hypothetical protein
MRVTYTDWLCHIESGAGTCGLPAQTIVTDETGAHAICTAHIHMLADDELDPKWAAKGFDGSSHLARRRLRVRQRASFTRK